MPSRVPGEYGMFFLWNKGRMFIDNLLHLRIIDEVIPFMKIIP